MNHYPDRRKEMERPKTLWTFVITSVALFMVVLDNLVVSTALPVIRTDLGASLEELEWTVNAYTLTILSEAFPKEKRGLALGAWSGIAGLAVASGPLVGGAVVDGISWQWIFWLNVPIGILLVPLALRFLRETYGPDRGLDLPGLALVSVGLLGLVWGLIHGNGDGWTSPQIVGSLAVGAILTAAFVAWELRTPAPMLPMRFFRDRAFAAANGASLLMYFGMFGSIFLLTQFFQTAQGYSPLEAGLRVLPWTIMPMFVAPIAGALSDRIGGRPFLAGGLALQAIGLGWIAAGSSADR